jgi:hypothetical protein
LHLHQKPVHSINKNILTTKKLGRFLMTIVMRTHKTKSVLFVTITMLWAGLAQAQQGANASGGNATGIGGTVTYTVGQVVYTTNTSSSGSVSQGVQNTFEIYSVGTNETALNISIIAFPNPTFENLTLTIDNYSDVILSYQLYDMQGKLLSGLQITGTQTQIIMSDLPAAIYFIDVIDQENKKIQSFKIVKN